MNHREGMRVDGRYMKKEVKIRQIDAKVFTILLTICYTFMCSMWFCEQERSALRMNGNRGHYASAPLNNMKNKKNVQATAAASARKTRTVQRSGWLTVMVTLVLPVLFLLAFLIESNVLRLIFLGAAAICVAAMWLMNVFAHGARSTLTIAYIALMAVIGLSLVLGMQNPESRAASVTQKNQTGQFTDKANTDALSAYLANNAATPTPAVYVVEESAVSSAQKQLENFLVLWQENNIPGMLGLCTPSWVQQQQNPEGVLWNLMMNRRPVGYLVEEVSGSEADTSRTITVKVTFLNEGTGETAVNRMQVLLFRVNDVWYVDPQSLGGTVVDEAAELMKAQQEQNKIASTKAPATPTPEPQQQDTLKLYYNADGGKYYHATNICDAVSQQYWPLSEFYYTDLNTTGFKNLIKCPKCNPPDR